MEIKTPEILKDIFDNAKGGERTQAAIDYYQSKYNDNPIMLRVMILAIEYYPLVIEIEENIDRLNQIGSFTSTDIAKSKFVIFILKKIIQENGSEKKSDKQIIDEAESELELKVKDRIQIVQ